MWRMANCYVDCVADLNMISTHALTIPHRERTWPIQTAKSFIPFFLFLGLSLPIN